MYSLVTFRYITMVRVLIFCTFEVFGARAFSQRSLSRTGTHPESELGTCKLCGLSTKGWKTAGCFCEEPEELMLQAGQSATSRLGVRLWSRLDANQ